MAEIKKLSLKVDNKFDEIQCSLESVKDEVSKLKANMVTHDIFQKLEDRVDNIESQIQNVSVGGSNVEIQNLRQILSKLDPANKSLRIRGFKVDSVGDRVSSIDKMSGDIGIKYQSVDHVYKGKFGQRSLSDMCIVEFSSNEDRERALQLARRI